jgi:hypothetical protein
MIAPSWPGRDWKPPSLSRAANTLPMLMSRRPKIAQRTRTTSDGAIAMSGEICMTTKAYLFCFFMAVIAAMSWMHPVTAA